MASNEGLNVAIGANLGGLTTGLDRAVSSLERFANTLESIAASLVTAFNSVQPAVNNTASTVTTLATSVNNLSPITATAAAGITNLSSAITSGQASFTTLGTTSTQTASGLNTLGVSATNAVNSINTLSPASGATAAGITNLANAVQSGQASFTGLVNASNQVIPSLNTLSTTSQRAAASINNLSPVSAAAAAGITSLSQAIVSGNATFVRGSNAVTNYADNLQGINRNTIVASSSINRLSPVTGAAALGITNLTRAVNSGQASLTGISRTAQYAVAANQRLAASTQNVIRPTVNANGALSGFNNIIRDAPFGIIGIGNNITQLADAFGQLQRQTGSTSGALRALGSSVFGPAGLITIGLSAAISLWTVYSMKQQQAASKAKAAAEEIKNLAKITQDAAISSNQFAASAAGEITALNRLFAVARDETKSREERTNALKELKAQTNGYLKDLTLETAQTEAARKSLDLYNKSLFDSALAKAYQGQIDDLAKSYAQTKEKADKGRKAIEDFDAALERQKQRLLKSQISAKDRLNVPEQDAKNSIARNKLIQQTNGYIKDQNAFYEQILAKGTQLADLQAKVNPFSKTENKATSSGKTIADVLKDLQLELSSIDAQAILTGATFDGVAKDKITALQKAFEDLVKLGLQPTSPEIKKIAGEINSLSDKIIGKSDINGVQLFKFDGKDIISAEAQLIHLGSEIKRLTGSGFDPASEAVSNLTSKYDILKSAIGNKPLFDIGNFVEVDGKLKSLSTGLVNLSSAQARFNSKNAAFKEQLASVKPALSELVSAINTSIQGLALDGFTSAIESAMSGGGIQGAIKSFANIFGGYLQNLGKQAIVYSNVLKGIEIAIKSLSPAAAVVAGGLAIVAGTALKAYASKVPSFATGGVVTEPTLAMVGDNPGKKEAIIPSELWDKIGGGGSGYIAETRISGGELVILLKKAEREGRR